MSEATADDPSSDEHGEHAGTGHSHDVHDTPTREDLMEREPEEEDVEEAGDGSSHCTYTPAPLSAHTVSLHNLKAALEHTSSTYSGPQT